MEETLKKIIKAYDIRGEIPEELNPDVAFELGKRFAYHFKPELVVIGNDMRETSEEIKQGFINGLVDYGIDVIDIGLVSTPMLNWGAWHLKASHGVMVTASHSPLNYNGIKLVDVENGQIYKENGLTNLLKKGGEPSGAVGSVTERNTADDYLSYLGKHIEDLHGKFVFDTMHGANGLVLKEAFDKSDVEAEYISFEVDGQVPDYQSPNPLIEANQEKIKKAIREKGFEAGLMYDGDADRLIVFDDKARYVSANFVAYLIIEYLLEANPGRAIVFDLRSSNMIRDLAAHKKAKYFDTIAGNPYVKEKMREEKAIFGGETSGHYFYEETNYAEDAIVTSVYFIKALKAKGKKLSEIIDDLNKKYFMIPETNFRIADYKPVFKELEEIYKSSDIHFLDGITIEAEGFRANLRTSNTEPLIRLNLEARGQEELTNRLKEIKGVIKANGGVRADH
ncbi:MAG: Phosphomannomutase [candidate division CPR2 bacterium GW2011_GWC1_41_48]|uniref:Phosphomannomutase n=1 Tax=candidate division CPR2 bacterium GW2011_GWC1_41_48 TaxID=1618344 RepID=A0A0G0Z8M0_UNCC2|nr:MAG: Phosphomannomutase [candidate division CPR2 bacterium GW2011_GWC2_39_35]KKR27682.1 MAG: Phosphomannomutase [candidate division CPR2 bacterium GW2011_GWD2_39_7]KKS09393.1 MAG: Phosphomannomutase [candidate division CPR2 bacterium GW2011_GWC1_41_48]